jgi:hypothetical protein
MKAYGGVDVKIQIFLTSALVGGEWSASYPGHFTRGTHWRGGWVNPRAGLNNVGKRTFLTLSGLEIRTLVRPALSQSLYWLRYPKRQVNNWHQPKDLRVLWTIISTDSKVQKSYSNCSSSHITAMRIREYCVRTMAACSCIQIVRGIRECKGTPVYMLRGERCSINGVRGGNELRRRK